MPRPQQLHQDGQRRTITFRADLDKKLRVMAAERRVPISVVVEELVERSLQQSSGPEARAIEFPQNWDGGDLRERLYILRMRQADLAAVIHAQAKTLNHWLNGVNAFPLEILPEIQKALKAWKPGPILDFKEGSRSPRV